MRGVDKSENSSSATENERCRPHNEAVLKFLAERRGPTAVVLVGRWAYYTSGRGIGLDAHNRIALQTDLDPAMPGASQADRAMASLSGTLNELHRRGLAVFLLQQVPEFPDYSAPLIGRLLQSGGLTVQTVLSERILVSIDGLSQRQAPFDRFLLANESPPYVLLKTHPLFCTASGCSATLDGRPAYFDTNHVTATTSRAMATVFRSMIPPETGASVSTLPSQSVR